jgi:hypothetical protein
LQRGRLLQHFFFVLTTRASDFLFFAKGLAV